MSNVQLTKQHKNATTDKLNVNLRLIPKEVSLISRWLKVVRSLHPVGDFGVGGVGWVGWGGVGGLQTTGALVLQLLVYPKQSNKKCSQRT